MSDEERVIVVEGVHVVEGSEVPDINFGGGPLIIGGGVNVVEGDSGVHVVDGDHGVNVVEGGGGIHVVEGDGGVHVVEGDGGVHVVEGDGGVHVVGGFHPITILPCLGHHDLSCSRSGGRTQILMTLLSFAVRMVCDGPEPIMLHRNVDIVE